MFYYLIVARTKLKWRLRQSDDFSSKYGRIICCSLLFPAQVWGGGDDLVPAVIVQVFSRILPCGLSKCCRFIRQIYTVREILRTNDNVRTWFFLLKITNKMWTNFFHFSVLLFGWELCNYLVYHSGDFCTAKKYKKIYWLKQARCGKIGFKIQFKYFPNKFSTISHISLAFMFTY
jgi:hypothetical protein